MLELQLNECSTLNLKSDILILTDFEIMKEAFSKRAISNRQFSDNVRADIENMQRRLNYDEIPKSILDENDPLFKNGAGNRVQNS